MHVTQSTVADANRGTWSQYIWCRTFPDTNRLVHDPADARPSWTTLAPAGLFHAAAEIPRLGQTDQPRCPGGGGSPGR